MTNDDEWLNGSQSQKTKKSRLDWGNKSNAILVSAINKYELQ